MELLIKKQISECQAQGIQIITVLLNTSRDENWRRIQQRLLEQPERLRFHENDFDHFQRSRDFYESYHWDYTISNDQPLEAMKQLIN